MGRLFGLIILFLFNRIAFAEGSKAASLCASPERIVFTCSSGSKLVSLCAKGSLRQDSGRLIYRYGRDRSHVELEYGSNLPLKQSTFTYHESLWAKGAAHAVGFTRGKFHYVVRQGWGVYGVDGGPNYAEFSISKAGKWVATLACNDEEAPFNSGAEFEGLSLPDEVRE